MSQLDSPLLLAVLDEAIGGVKSAHQHINTSIAPVPLAELGRNPGHRSHDAISQLSGVRRQHRGRQYKLFRVFVCARRSYNTRKKIPIPCSMLQTENKEQKRKTTYCCRTGGENKIYIPGICQRRLASEEKTIRALALQ